MGVLYGTPTYLELYAMRKPEDIRVENRIQHQQTGMLKQMRTSAFDKQVIRDAAETLKLKDYHVLHPKWMYQSLSPFWDGHQGMAWLMPKLAFTIPKLELSPGVQLPEKFVAVRFYARATFPAHPMTADVARETIKHLAKDQAVIVLNAGGFFDDHLDFELKAPIPNVFKLGDLLQLTPENNLGAQAAVLSKSLGFVGTYGGLAQLALRLKKPSISLYTDWGGTAWPHRTLSEMLAVTMGVPFNVLRVGDLPLMQSVLPKFVAQ
jgi:ADP-heptose:LPS heptosyltransferase